MAPPVSSPIYDDLIDLVVTRFLDFDSGEWIERHRLLDHVNTPLVRDVQCLGLVTSQDNSGAEERAIEERVVDDALSKIQQLMDIEARTVDGMAYYRFGSSPEQASSTTSTVNDATTQAVDTPAAFADLTAHAVPLSAAEDKGPVMPEHSSAGTDPGLSENASTPTPPLNCGGAAIGGIVMMRPEELRPHPSLAQIPTMQPQEWERFLEDVRHRGITDPVTGQQGGILLDGSHRLRAAQALGYSTIPLRLVDLTEDEQLDHVYGAALRRRTLTDDQRAALAAEWVEQKATRSRQQRARQGGQSGGRGRSQTAPIVTPPAVPDSLAPQTSVTPSSPLRVQAAKQFRVSERKVKRQRQLRRDHPELAEEVRNGTKTQWQAYCEAQKRRQETGASQRQVIDVSAPILRCIAPPASTTADKVLVLTLVGPSPQALLNGLVDHLGLEPTLQLLLATVQLGQQRREQKVPTSPADNPVQDTDRELVPELMI